MGQGKSGRHQVLSCLQGAAFLGITARIHFGCSHLHVFFLILGADHSGCLLFWRTKRKRELEEGFAFLGCVFSGLNAEELCAKGGRA